MFTLSLLFLACSVDGPESTTTTPVTGTIQSPQQDSPKSAEQSGPDTNGSSAKNLEITESGLRVRLPALNSKSGVSKYCFLQQMPDLDIGMTSLSFETSAGVQFVRLQGISPQAVSADTNKWMDCSVLGDNLATKSIYEMVGIDLEKATSETLFNGFQWFVLPESMAFGFPGTELWYYEVQLDEGSDLKDVSVITNVSTKPQTEVERWAGVIDIAMEDGDGDTFEAGCSFPKDIEVLSVFGHSEPTKGTWTVQCGDQEMFSVESKLFAKDIPPLKSFETPKGIASGTKCTLKCDWDGDVGEICIASLVAAPIEEPIRCVN